jgi:hypothetical protein
MAAAEAHAGLLRLENKHLEAAVAQLEVEEMLADEEVRQEATDGLRRVQAGIYRDNPNLREKFERTWHF